MLTYLPKCLKAQWQIVDGKKIFYPNNNKKGYIATEEQIQELEKAFRKLFYFNIFGYKKDVEKIFANCETIDIPLPRTIYQQNLADSTSWTQISFLVVLNIILAISMYKYKIAFITILICTVIVVNNIVMKKFHKK